MGEHIFTFTITVARRGDCESPRTEKEAVALIGYLLEQGSFLELLDMRRAESILVGQKVAQ
jgi:hypothetical protein